MKSWITDLTLRHALKDHPQLDNIPGDMPFASIFLNPVESAGTIEHITKRNNAIVWLAWKDGAVQTTSNDYLGKARGKAITIIRFRGGFRNETIGLLAYWTSILKLELPLAMLRERVAQARFIKVKRFQKDRIVLLNHMANIALCDRPNDFGGRIGQGRNHVDWFEQIHSIRAFGHPNFDSELTAFHNLLESLVDTGHLRKFNGHFILTGKAIELIQEDAKLERQHADAKRMNCAMVLLTVFIALGTIYPIIDDLNLLEKPNSSAAD